MFGANRQQFLSVFTVEATHISDLRTATTENKVINMAGKLTIWILRKTKSNKHYICNTASFIIMCSS